MALSPAVDGSRVANTNPYGFHSLPFALSVQFRCTATFPPSALRLAGIPSSTSPILRCPPKEAGWKRRGRF